MPGDERVVTPLFDGLWPCMTEDYPQNRPVPPMQLIPLDTFQFREALAP